jgi:hypothetical protein
MFGNANKDGVFSGTVQRDKSARVKYWRKPEGEATDSGWIQTGPDLNTDLGKYQTFLAKRYRELPDSFGKEVAGLPKSSITPMTPYTPGNEHRWLQTFMNNGGLTYVIRPGDAFGTAGQPLMPARQIVTLNLHRLPGMKELRPDVADAVDLPCPSACMAKDGKGRRLFSGLTQAEAENARDQHVLATHQNTIASRAIGDEIAKVLSASQGIDATTIASIVAAVMAATKAGTVPVVEHVEAEPELPELPEVSWDEAVEIFGFDPKQQANQWPEESWRPSAIHAYIKYRNTGPPEYPHDAGFWKAPPGGGSTFKSVLIAHITDLHLKSAARKRALTGFVPTEETQADTDEPAMAFLDAFAPAPAA